MLSGEIVLMSIESWMTFLWTATWQVAVLIGLTWSLERLFGHFMGPKLRYALWCVVFVRLLIPVFPESRLSVMNFAPKLVVDQLGKVDKSLDTGLAEDHFVKEIAENTLRSSEPIEIDHRPRVVKVRLGPEYGESWHLPLVLFGVWLAGLFAVGSYILLSYAYFLGKLAGTCRPCSERIQFIFDSVSRTFSIKPSGVPLVCSSEVLAPLLVGFFKPKLILPENVDTLLNDEELRHVFMHELVHVRRRDYLVNVVLLSMQCIHWFNPLVWLGYRSCKQRMEFACDASAIKKFSPQQRVGYARTLLRVLELNSPWSVFQTSFMDNNINAKERITMITHQARTNLWTQGCSLLTLAVILAVGFTKPVLKASEAQLGNLALKEVIDQRGKLGYEKVKEKLQQIYHSDPSNEKVLYWLAVNEIEATAGNLALAEELLLKIVEMNPAPKGWSVPWALTRLGQVYDKNGDPGRSLSYYEESLEPFKAIGGVPSYVSRWWQNAAKTHSAKGETEWKRGVEFFRKAFPYTQKGSLEVFNFALTLMGFDGGYDVSEEQLNEAKLLFEQVAYDAPESIAIDSLWALLKIAIKEKDGGLASAYYERIAEITSRPENVKWGRQKVTDSAMAMKAIVGAEATEGLLKSIARSDPDNRFAVYWLGSLYMDAKDLKKAVQLYEGLLMRMGEDQTMRGWLYPWTYYRLGVLHKELGNRDEAYRYLSNCLKYRQVSIGYNPAKKAEAAIKELL